MKSSNEKAIDLSGFELLPKGRLLQQFIEISGDCGIAYERCIQYTKDFHHHNRINLAFPRGSTVVEIQTPQKKWVIDQKKFFVIPAGLPHDHRGVSTVYDTVALYPTAKSIRANFEKVGASEIDIGDFIAKPKLWSRSVLLDELVSNYLLLRISKSVKNKKMAKAQEDQILQEIGRIVSGKNKLKEGLLRNDGNSVASRAITIIESSLFLPISIDEIARRSNTSVASLFRHFEHEVRMTPFTYIRNRRLDEARTLIGSKLSVGEVGLLVGYEDLSSFSKAFKHRFGYSPQTFKKRTTIPLISDF